MSTPSTNPLLEELSFRGLLHQSTNLEGLGQALASGPKRIYAGFDPTADSLTVGNLVPIMVLKHLQRAGHTPVVLMGGGTGLIGDPSGKSQERLLLDEATIAANVAGQSLIFESILAFDGENAAQLVNNLSWLKELGFIQVLRDVGKHFSVNMMIQKDSVRDRLNNREQGISYTEFSYMILQAYDFLHLFESSGVTIQLGGSDQWGNIVAGVDLIRRRTQKEAFGMTAPLVTKADGGKFGKSEKDAVWLTTKYTSPYAYYQFWINVADADVERFLKMFTMLGRGEIAALMAEHTEDPGKRLAQKALAREATSLLHGSNGLKVAQSASDALFSGDITSLSENVLLEVFRDVPASEHALSELASGIAIVDLLAMTSLCKSKREAREFLGNGAVQVNGKVVAADASVGPSTLLFGKLLLLKRGKRAWHVMRWA